MISYLFPYLSYLFNFPIGNLESFSKIRMFYYLLLFANQAFYIKIVTYQANIVNEHFKGTNFLANLLNKSKSKST